MFVQLWLRHHNAVLSRYFAPLTNFAGSDEGFIVLTKTDA